MSDAVEPKRRIDPARLNVILLVLLCVITFGLSLGAPVAAYWPDLLKVLIATGAMQLLRYRYKRMDERPLMAALDGASLLIVFATVYTIATYMGATYSAKLWDETFASWDASLGLNAYKVVMWVRGISWWDTLLNVAYTGYFFQFAFLVPYTAGIRRQPDRMHQALAQMFMCALISLSVFTLMPSLNTLTTFDYKDLHGIAQVNEHILSVRAGQRPILRFEDEVQGLIQFPSMHAALAVVFAWDLRHDHRVLFGLYALWNVLVVFSAIPMGAHYIVDVIAGVVMAIGVIVLVQWLTGTRGAKKQASLSA